MTTNIGKQPAFPRAGNEWDEMSWVAAPAEQGMTLRDYFAAKAMQAMLSDEPDYHQKYEFIDLADFSYQCADAMLKAREI